MKAYLLAAGLGTRLRPITNTITKCLVPICDKPLLGWWIDLFEQHGVTDVLINLHHFPEQVKTFLGSNSGGVKFEYYFEETLIGSGGTLRENKSFVKGEDSFCVFYADNLTNINLSKFVEYHKEKKQIFSMALFRSPNSTACGIALLDENGTIVDFEEKPKQPKSNLANAGVYVAHPDVLDLIPNLELTDIGFHLLPKLIGKMAGWEINDYLIDIGTIESLQRAEVDWVNITNFESKAK